jgi:hypothetical protein
VAWRYPIFNLGARWGEGEAGWAPCPVKKGVENLARAGFRWLDLLTRSESLYRLTSNCGIEYGLDGSRLGLGKLEGFCESCN